MTRHGRTPHKQDTKQASIAIAVLSVIGLVICFVVATLKGQDVPLVLYALFGGGILGTDSIIKLLKSVFRISDER